MNSFSDSEDELLDGRDPSTYSPSERDSVPENEPLDGADPSTWSPTGFGDNDKFDSMDELVEEDSNNGPMLGEDPSTWSPTPFTPREEPVSEPMLGEDPATWSPTSRGSTDTVLSPLTISDYGNYRVQDCPTYLSDVFEGDEEAESLFSPILAKVETEAECTGICNERANLPYYVFSNVNNGWAEKTCKTALTKELRLMTSFFYIRVVGCCAFIALV
jgi:hypothetical protein